MNYYVNIRVLSNPEYPDTVILNETFVLFHRAIVVFGVGEIGISFPEVSKTLGNILRIHGPKDSLNKFMASNWIAKFTDYVVVSEVLVIPAEVNYRVVKRIQAKNSAERLIRRSVRKGWLSQEDACSKLSSRKQENLSLPFLRVKSQSTECTFRLFIEHSPIVHQPVPGKFTAYGLSSEATIPWF